MHSQSALTELTSPNLAPFLLLHTVYVRPLIRHYRRSPSPPRERERDRDREKEREEREKEREEREKEREEREKEREREKKAEEETSKFDMIDILIGWQK